jgi:hypothetical protein
MHFWNSARGILSRRLLRTLSQARILSSGRSHGYSEQAAQLSKPLFYT